MKIKIFSLLAVAALLGAAGCARPLSSGLLVAGVEAAGRGDWQEAAAAWRRAVQRDPRSAAAHNNLAVFCERQGAWAEARREYEEALRIDPDNGTIKANFADFKARVEPGRGKGP
jgi:Flp pilus assembly protein TadD